jgi:hypothetical protein
MASQVLRLNLSTSVTHRVKLTEFEYEQLSWQRSYFKIP